MRRVRLQDLVVIFLSALFISACTQDTTDTGAEATIVSTENLETTLGTATLSDAEGGGVTLTLNIGPNDVISGGEHAIHVHENGSCEPGDSDDDGVEEAGGAAGGHYNPTGVGHGEDDGPHVGDSDNYNYAFSDDGSFSGEIAFPLASLEGENLFLKEGGSAVVIHAGVDDKETNPGGNSGARVACGVITAVTN